jgi:hypothetical protein
LEKDEFDNKVKRAIEIFNRPVLAKEIAEELATTMASVLRALNRLASSEQIGKIQTQSRTYYFIQTHTTVSDIDTMNNIVAKATVNAVDANEDLKEDIKNVQGKIDQIYLSIISLMGIFVAIFALITVNINLVYKVAISPNKDAVITSIIINVSAIFMIAVLLLLMRWLIINPLKHNTK